MASDSITTPPTLQCRHCRRDLPLNGEHFHRHAGRRLGFRETCRECRNQQRQLDRRERYARAQKTALLKLSRDIKAGRCSADSLEVMSILSSNLGGAEGVGAALAELVKSPKATPRTAFTVLSSVMAMSERVEQAQRQMAEERRQKLGQQSPEELEEHLLELTEQLLSRIGMKMVPIDGD